MGGDAKRKKKLKKNNLCNANKKQNPQQIDELPDKQQTESLPTAAEKENRDNGGGNGDDPSTSSKQHDAGSHPPSVVRTIRAPVRDISGSASNAGSRTETVISVSRHSTTTARTVYATVPPPEVVTVGIITRKNIFPRVKYLNKDDARLSYSENQRSICYKIMCLSNVPPTSITFDRERWWDNARKWVAKAITNKRNDVTSRIKSEFMGKYSFFL